MADPDTPKPSVKRAAPKKAAVKPKKLTTSGNNRGLGSKPGECGSPPHVVTREARNLVGAYMIAGLSQEQAARALCISVETLHRHYRHELDNAHADAVAGVGGSLLQRAMAGDTQSAIFYLKTRGRWSETSKVEHSGPDGGKIEVAQNVTATALLASLTAAQGKTDSE